ncbi:MAG: hypothetical protein V1653_00465 [bacterium]
MATIKKEDIQRAKKNLKKFGSKVKEIAMALKEDAIYGAQIGNLGIKNLGLERDRLLKLKKIAEMTYKLVRTGKIKNVALAKECAELETIEKTIKKQKAQISQISKKI